MAFFECNKATICKKNEFAGKLSVMTRELRSSNCTNVEWLGRVDCARCHVRKLMLFSELPETAFDKLLQPIDHFRFPRGVTLYETGGDDRVIYSIRQGLVKLMHYADDGTRRIVRLLGPGASVGLELLDGVDGYRHTAVTVNEVDACRIPLATVNELQSRYPALCNQVRQHLQDHLDRADKWILALGAGPARERVAHLLLMLGEFSTDPNGDIGLLGREDMAAIVGTSVETVSRIIAEFKRGRLLYKVAEDLYRIDKPALQAIAHAAAG
jgi:CRP-like cAMP-binding protein